MEQEGESLQELEGEEVKNALQRVFVRWIDAGSRSGGVHMMYHHLPWHPTMQSGLAKTPSMLWVYSIIVHHHR